jgi:hypothetical protein
LRKGSVDYILPSLSGTIALALGRAYREEQDVPCEETVFSDGLLQRLVKAAGGFRQKPQQQGGA